MTPSLLVLVFVLVSVSVSVSVGEVGHRHLNVLRQLHHQGHLRGEGVQQLHLGLELGGRRDSSEGLPKARGVARTRL